MTDVGKIAILAIIVFIAFIFVSPVHAQLGRQTFNTSNFTQSASVQLEIDLAETEFSKPGMLPDHPLYFLKRFSENIRLIFAPDSEKPRLHLELAKVRLSEAKKLAEENKTEEIGGIVREFNREINQSGQGMGQNISALVKERENMLKKSVLVLGLVLDRAPEQAKPTLEQALNNSIEKHIRITIGDVTQEEIRQAVEKERQEIEERLEEKREEKSRICIQVITPARNMETDEVRDFPTPCDVPDGWVKISTGQISAVTHGAAKIEEKTKSNDESPVAIDTPAAPPVSVAGLVAETLPV